jgi:hypothetical protein
MTWHDEVVVVHAGTIRTVVMLPKVAKEYDKLRSDKIRAAIERHIETYSGGGKLLPSHFNTEGHWPIANGVKTQIFAFKSDYVRLYGGLLTVEGDPLFICSEIDKNKKQQAADQERLARAARNLEPFINRDAGP